MRLRHLAVVGLATGCYGRRLRVRQLTQYDGNATDTVITAILETTSTVTTISSPSSPTSYQSDASDTSPIIAPIPYSSPKPSPSDYTATTTTAVQYTIETSVETATTPTTYSSQKYSFAPVGSGTAPSAYSPPPPVTTPSPTYVGSSSTQLPTSYANATNATCGGATLNVLTASLDWWYTKTLYYAVSTFSIQFNRNDTSTGWTALPATDTFDVQSALAEPDCTSTPVWVASRNYTSYDYTCTPAASPIAAETTIITQTAYKDPPRPTGNGTLPPLVVTPPPASISVADATQSPYGQGTPFVFFSQYEIVTKSVTTFDNGSTGCAESTQVYQMDDAFSFEYTGPDVNGSQLVNEGVVGDVNPALLGLVGQDTAVAGSWVAEPTVVLLMQEVFVAQAALAATIEPTASSLDVPTPTRPTWITLKPTPPEGPSNMAPSPHVEISQTELQLPTPNPGNDNRPTGAAEQTQDNNDGGPGDNTPDDGPRPFTSLVAFIAHIAQSDVTLQLPAEPTQTIVTASALNQIVTATRLDVVQGNDGAQGGGGGGFGGLIAATNSAARPTPNNAFDVLSQAEATFSGANPTANAILNGIGGPAGSQAQENNLPGDSVEGGSGNGRGRIITAGGAAITPNAQGEYVIGSDATLTPGGRAVVAGTTYSLDSEASEVVVNGVTQTLGSSAEATGAAGSGSESGPDIPLITYNNAAITPNAATEYSIAPDATLTPGGSVVVDGTTLSLDSSASSIVINGQTRNLASPAEATVTGTDADAAAVTMAPILTINGQTFSAIGSDGTTYVIDGETLTMGEEETVTIDGTTYQISLSPSATRLVIETEDGNGQVTATSTQTLFPEQGSGSGSGASATASQSGSPEQQVGNAASSSILLSSSGAFFALGSLVLAIWL